MKRLLSYLNPTPPKGMIARATGRELWFGTWIMLWNLQFLVFLLVDDKDTSSTLIFAYQVAWCITTALPLYFPPVTRFLQCKQVIQ